VKSHIPTAIAFEQLDALVFQLLARGEDVLLFGIAAESDDRRVLEEKESVADFSLLSRGNKVLLKAQSGSVIQQAELQSGDQRITPVWILRPMSRVCQKR
jgi:hypothetical protein